MAQHPDSAILAETAWLQSSASDPAIWLVEVDETSLRDERRSAVDASGCQRLWLIASPQGPTRRGHCKKWGSEGEFYSFKHGHALQVTVLTATLHRHVPSLAELYFAAADWHERKASEMFGFVFDGHPNPKNLLLEEDLHIHPLLKAHPLQKMEIAQGIEDRDPGFKF